MKSSVKSSDLRSKDGDALGKELTDLLKAQFGLRMQIATQQLSNTSQLKKVRRDIARVRTVMNENASRTAAQTTSRTAASQKAGRQ